MNSIFSFLRVNVYVILLYVVSIALVCLAFPRGGMFPYEFHLGKVWGHEDLYAPFDIPILKTSQELDNERDSLLRDFVVYYNEVSEVATHQKSLFNQTFDQECLMFEMTEEDLNKLYLYIDNKLDIIYERGVLPTSEEDDDIQTTSDQIAIVRNNIAERDDIYSVFSPKIAYEWLISALERDYNQDDMALIKQMNLDNYIQPNLVFNADITNTAMHEQINRISHTKGLITSNRRIIERGEFVNEEKFNLLTSFRYEFENRIGFAGNFGQIWAGQAIIIIFCFLLVFLYLFYFRPKIFSDVSQTAFLLLLMTIFTGISCIVIRNDYFNLYLMPYVLMPIIIYTFYDARTANFIYWVSILLISFIIPNSFEFVFLSFATGLIGIVNVKNIHRRGSLLITVAFVVLAYCVTYLALLLMQGVIALHVDWMNFARFSVNGLLIFLLYPLVLLFEKLFGFISNITLMELSDTNQPLLRKLSELAPGTFQHSMQVANLAEEVIRKIGGNPLLMRTGALYHDVGKMKHPEYFIENQSGRNPHDDLLPEESAKRILEHVTHGVEIARKKGLSNHLINFIRTHHGTSVIRYFYNMELKRQGTADKEKYTYPGPAPFSKEMAVLMMCDAIEAASRTLKEINNQTISELVDNIVNYQIQEKQYDDADITYKQVSIAKQTIKNRLINIYHARIEYPK
jgi:putative nucleotidyltransferase with HDIG domain